MIKSRKIGILEPNPWIIYLIQSKGFAVKYDAC